jgi:acyl dehydratase
MSTATTSRTAADVNVGDTLPELVIDITATTVVGGALATRDFTPVHHDRAHAQSQGLSDIIMNTMTTNGFVSRFVTDWTGPDTIIKGISIKLGAPNYPGDTMKMTGTVAAKEDDGTITIDVVGSNSWGDHVSGTVTITLPAGT